MAAITDANCGQDGGGVFQIYRIHCTTVGANYKPDKYLIESVRANGISELISTDVSDSHTGRLDHQPNAMYCSDAIVRSRWSLNFVKKFRILTGSTGLNQRGGYDVEEEMRIGTPTST